MINILSDKIRRFVFFVGYDPLDVDPDYFSDDDIETFKEGSHFHLYEKLGAHIVFYKGIKGVYFSVWAPHAKKVTVMGGFNDWNKKSHPLVLREDNTGIWEGFVQNAKKGDMYKFCIFPSAFRKSLEKSDPYALLCEYPPKSASVVWESDYQWQDDQWLQERQNNNSIDRPISMYEVHLGSWKRKILNDKDEEKGFLSYRELAEELVGYVKEMGFTHVEFMPVMEHPFYASWGYQALGFYSPTRRYGDPEELMYLVDCFHREGIGVVLDWVPSHFPGDSFGLANFDGSSLYELDEYHPDWKSAVFNNGLNQVSDFLISNALFWIEKYHIDGLRVDAVASMLYLDYSRNKGEWEPNVFGGNENLDSVAFIRKLNEEIKKQHPDVIMIAEESTSWPKISRPIEQGGLGFDMKWNMGWMHDTLKYFKRAPEKRKKAQNDLTFSMFYAFNENFILSLSHDEVVHEKSSLLGKMSGTDEEKFSNLRCLYGYMFSHPGKKLLFMGAELAQWSEWAHDNQLEWDLLQYERHHKIRQLIIDLNKIYRGQKAFYELDFSQDGFKWLDLGDKNNCIISFLRRSRDQREEILVACNFSNKNRDEYVLNLQSQGQWEEIFNSSDVKYCENGMSSMGSIVKTQGGKNEMCQLTVDLPALTVKYYKKCEELNA